MDEQIYTLVGLWLESMIYGAYAILFMAAMHVSWRSKKSGGSFSMIFFLSMISMFIMITIYTGIDLSRGIRAYALQVSPPSPVTYYHDFSKWDNYAFGVIVTMLVWHADALVIYRCYIIWARNIWVIILPLILLGLSFAVNIITLTTFKKPDALPAATISVFIQMVYPVNLAQSILTTGLIAHRIISQHRKSHASGLHRAASGMSLLNVVRIIVESASIFTIQQIILLVLLEINHPAQVILHETLVPSMGLIFVLMTLRTHMAKTDSEGWSRGKSTGGPTSVQRAGQSGVAIITTRTVIEDHQMSVLDSKTQSQHNSDYNDNVFGDPKGAAV